MSQIMKAYTGVLMVLFMMVSAIGVLTAFLQVLEAQNFHSVAITEMEESGYAAVVLEEIFVAAQNKGYGITLGIYDTSGNYRKCRNISAIRSFATRGWLSDIYMAEITLTYPVQILFFEIDSDQTLIGVGR